MGVLNEGFVEVREAVRDFWKWVHGYFSDLSFTFRLVPIHLHTKWVHGRYVSTLNSQLYVYEFVLQLQKNKK